MPACFWRYPAPVNFCIFLHRLCCSLAAALAVLGAAAAPAAPKYSVLHLVSDDLNCSLSCYGHPLVQSPHIDKLAARSVRFDRAYCQYPLCNPSRASFMTGMRPGSTKVYENATHFRSVLPQVLSLPQSFSRAGAQAVRVGKLYHYGVPTQIGTSGLDDEASWQQVFNPIGHDKKIEDQIHTLTPGQFGGTLSWFSDPSDEPQTDSVGAAQAVQWLKQHGQQPFYLAVGFYRPHTPYVAPKRFFERYPLDQITLPAGPMKDAPGIPAAAYASYKKEQDQLTDAMRREILQAYYASTSFMDEQVGEVLGALEQLGLRDKTIVVFHSDHGYHLGDHGLWQKQSLWERSARVPLLIAVPGSSQAGKVCLKPVELVDLHATLTDLCALPDSGSDGKSLRPLLEDVQAAWTKPAITQVLRGAPQGTTQPKFDPRQLQGSKTAQANPSKATKGKGKAAKAKPIMGASVRNERYRYTQWDEGRAGHTLFDLMADPTESRNLVDDPAHAEALRELQTALRQAKL